MLNYQGVNNMVNVYITMERSTIFHGKIHELNGGSFHGYVTNYQRVSIPKGRRIKIIPLKSHLYMIYLYIYIYMYYIYINLM